MSYSLIIDESTNIRAEKQLCVIARYFSKAHKTILTVFLGMISLDSSIAEGIFNTIATFLCACHLDLAKCVGLATDGCSVMCGQNNSVITRFREVNNNIVHIKCICHSIQLCSSYTLRALSRNIEFMVSEAYTWFCHSTLRLQKYKSLYCSINIGDEPLKILKLSNSRWLSIAPCMQRLLQQYEELKLHFEVARDEERNYTADLLYQMYYDAENKLYLMFLEPILIELNRVNRLFQLDRCSPIKLTDEIVTMYRSILLRVVRPTTFTTWLSTMEYDIDNPENHLPLGAIYFGTNFTLFVEEATIDRAIVNRVKERCRNYLMELLREMRKRLPTNMEQLQ